jgi:hypothetical protein
MDESQSTGVKLRNTFPSLSDSTVRVSVLLSHRWKAATREPSHLACHRNSRRFARTMFSDDAHCEPIGRSRLAVSLPLYGMLVILRRVVPGESRRLGAS